MRETTGRAGTSVPLEAAHRRTTAAAAHRRQPGHRSGPRRRLRVALLAPARFPVAQPFAGGLEAVVANLADALQRRGHVVTLFAAEGSPGADPQHRLPAGGWEPSELARRDTSMPSRAFMAEHHAYLRLVTALAGPRGDDFDVVHDHSLHYLPVAMAGLVRPPVVTTLHTPPTPWLESAFDAAAGTAAGPPAVTVTAVSRATARQWRRSGVHAQVVPNGVDLDAWAPGPGGPDLLWSGRITPEKAPHLAVQVARRAGRRLLLAGPVTDRRYWASAVRPLLGDDVRYLGHLDAARLAVTVGRSGAVLVTPTWDEPFGLVVAEALACGTPVVAFDRGGVGEVLGLRQPGHGPTGALVAAAGRTDADVVADAAAAVPAVLRLDRAGVRRYAQLRLSRADAVSAYVRLYESLATRARLEPAGDTDQASAAGS